MKRAKRALGLVALFFVLHGLFVLFKGSLESSNGDGTTFTDEDSGSSDTAPASDEFAVDNDPPTSTSTSSDDASQSRINSTLCQYNECLKGHWVPRDPPFESLADFQKVFATKGSTIWSKCEIADPPAGVTRTPEEKQQLEQQRMVDIMNWVWQPARGEQIPWDAEDLVVRLLKTPGGIVFMGDSLSQGHDHSFGSYLQEAGMQLDVNPPHLPKDSGIRSHILHPGHPKTLELQKRAGVPDSRMKYPVYSIIEEHMLVHEDDLRYLTGLYGAQPDWEWHLHSMKRADDWGKFFKWMTETRPGEEESVTKDTILFLNTGAHWSRGTLYMLPETGDPVEERSILTQVYRTMVKMVIQRFSEHTRLTILYRATNPGHPSCHLYTKPFSDAAEALKDEARFLELTDAQATNPVDRKVRRRWDWDMFNTHSQVWRKEIEGLQRERKASIERGEDVRGVKWLFVDLYEMSLQRPDAHGSPGRDCLHWCLPAVYNEWSRHIYHLLYLEMEQ
ncbi:hypothetical protein H1R20_g9758, partial [Candolleomyces eurysporus]